MFCQRDDALGIHHVGDIDFQMSVRGDFAKFLSDSSECTATIAKVIYYANRAALVDFRVENLETR